MVRAQAQELSEPKAPARLLFEVAALKAVKGPVTFSMDPSVRVGTAITWVDLITSAYGVRYDQIPGAPGWGEINRYDLEAKAENSEGALTRPQLREMLQSLLADGSASSASRDSGHAGLRARGGEDRAEGDGGGG
jgi:hypothetical protein